MSMWQPIETAPKDGSLIDVWVRDFSIGEGGKITVSGGNRQANVFWGDQYHYEGIGSDRKLVPHDTGWCETDYAYPGGSNLIECGTQRATHWMPLPPPPEGAE